ncbi:MAG: LysM peptidoglycan-binding domain-containing protein [Patescibacteria group bacterium]|nr:LysM peptidoglycan-binding domain-containing protein [Patescibacteria group bacterium]
MRIKRFQKTRQYFSDVFKKIQKYFYTIENFVVHSFRRRSFFGVGKFIRQNGSLTVIVIIATLVTFGNISAKSNNDDTFLVGHWSENDKQIHVIRESEDSIILDGGVVSDVQTQIITSAEKESNDAQTELSLLSNADEELLGDPENEGDVILYTVKLGDTFSKIAQAHGVTMETLFWANEIEDVDDIAPGDTLFILPVSGLKHKVKSGDTIEKIAKEYEVDKKEIIAHNGLPANGELTKGEEIVIPGAQKDIPEPEPDPIFAPREYVATGDGSTNLGSKVVSSGKVARKGGNSFPYGYCTYHVANKRNVTWRGNAGAWLYNAKAAGMKTGKKPKAGAIVVTTEDARYGHVGYVEKVGKDTITISEMNYNGWGVVNRRTLSQNARVIRGYIY